ncbi:AsmA family protein [Azotobacter chroococcum]|uniref:AsmA family protein n=1 Tax=Azotobacter chroococcum TaxID=353 RepID=UPI0010AE8589|nr:AsmA family protein [Azotobacter chroococcum]TKD30729.1 AsmA family protein [Azotobacter chroococcum]
MKTLGKILGLIVLGLLLVVVALGFALTQLFDPNDYKDEIRQLARDKANLELTLNGDIGWSLFPWLGLQLQQTSVASTRTPDQPLADLEMIGLSVRVLPLLRREIQMSDIRVDGLELHLRRDKQGRGNWEDLGRPAQAGKPEQPKVAAGETAPPAEAPVETPADNTARALRLDIDSLTLNNARVDYLDERSGQKFSAESIQLSSGAIRPDSDIPLKLTAFFGSNQPVLRARTDLEGVLRFDPALQRFQLNNARLSGEASGEPLKGKTLNFAAQGELLADLAAQVAEWNGLKLSANQLRAIGELKVRELDKNPQLSGGLSIAQFNPREFLAGIGQELPATADPASLTRLELSSQLSGTPSAVAFDKLDLKLDDSRFTGSIAVADFARQALRLQLKGDKLDLDRYLAPKSEKKEAAGAARQAEVKGAVAVAVQNSDTPLPEAPTQQAWSEEAVLPVDTLRKLDLQASLDVGQLTLDQLPIGNAHLQATAKDGLLTLKSLRGELFGGSFDVQARLDARPSTPQLSVLKRLSRIPVEKFIKTEGKEEPPIKGLLDLNADLETRGNSQKAWVEGLNGTASFVLHDGVLPDANLEQQLCLAIATLNRKGLNNPPNAKDTPFEELKGSLRFTNGVASNPDLKARIPGLTVNGNGDLDLRVLGMDYRIGVIIEGDKRAMPDAACQVNERYVGLEWPVRCRGPLELGAKACRLDRDGLRQIAAKLAGEKLNEKLEEKLGDKVSPELKDALKGLFNR